VQACDVRLRRMIKNNGGEFLSYSETTKDWEFKVPGA